MKKKKVKPRIPVAPPRQRHKSVKDYDRKKLKVAIDALEDIDAGYQCTHWKPLSEHDASLRANVALTDIFDIEEEE